MKIKSCNLKRVLSWLAVVAWMVVIFLFSAQTGDNSGDTSGAIVRWVVGVIHWGFEELPEVRQAEILEIWHTIIRKGAHFTEYAILAALIANAVRICAFSKKLKWGIPIVLSALYAVTDELHQYFVPDRACRLLDVCIDTAGAIFGTGLFMLAVLLKGKVKKDDPKYSL